MAEIELTTTIRKGSMEHTIKTLREIHQQPEVWLNCFRVLDEMELEPLFAGHHPHSCEWLFVGCGTSYYLAQAAAASLSSLGGDAAAVPASEILFFPEEKLRAGTRVYPVLISRSGHTSEVLQVGELLNQRGIPFLAITCDGNELAGLTPHVLKLPVVEESTVMTSSFTSMLLSLQYLAAYMLGKTEFLEALRELPAALTRLLLIYDPQVERFARRTLQNVTVLGQGALFPIASEATLKVMESSSTYAACFHTLEFRHGPKSIVSDQVLIGALLSESGYAEECAVLEEMKELGAQTFVIGNRLTAQARNAADLAIELELEQPELARLAIYVVWGQLLGSYLGLYKGLNPDTPRNLSRVVTLAV